MSGIKDLKQNAIRTAAYDTILQIFLRMVSFVLNALIVRWISRDAFAVMNVRIHLLYSTGLLLSREAFRRASLSMRKNQDIKKLINLVWLGAFASIPLSGVGGYIWSFVMQRPAITVTQYYDEVVILVMVSVLVEVCAESPYILSELQLWPKTKVIIEGIMQVMRAIFLASGIYLWPHKAILVYGISHITGSFIYSGLYYTWFAYQIAQKKTVLVGSFRELFPSFTIPFRELIDPKMGLIAWNFFKQGWVKEILTEGEFYLMNFVPTVPLSHQGTYQIVTNLSSLAARLVFRPAEASAYKFFAQALDRGKPMVLQQQKNAEEVTQILIKVSQHLLLLVLIILTFGWSYSHAFLSLYGGNALGESGTSMMRAQTFYVALLAMNGISEAFTFATMNENQLSRHNFTLIIYSILYLISCIISSSMFGAMGFFFSNCLNMMLRITNSVKFIMDFYKGTRFQLSKCYIMSFKIWTVFGAVFCVCAISEIYVYPTSFCSHIFIGITCLCFLTYYLRYKLYLVISLILKIVDNTLQRIFKTQCTVHSKYTNMYLSYIYEFLYKKSDLNKLE